jgi:uncharacterized protein involved in exopolysaccharide biosynthesis
MDTDIRHSAQQPAREELLSKEEISLLDLALVIKTNWRILVFTPLTVGLLALGWAFLMKPTFTATTQLTVPQQQQSALQSVIGGLGILGGALTGGKSPADQWVALLKSRTVADGLIDKFHLVDYYAVDYRFQAVDRLEGKTKITTGKEGLIKIEVSDRDPKLAAQIANAYIGQLQALSRNLALTEASQRRLFFEKQLGEAKNKLIDSEIALNETGISLSVLRTSPEASVTEMGRLKGQIAASQVKLSVMRGYMTDSSSDVQQVQRELASLKAQLQDAAKNDPEAGQGSGPEYIRRLREFKYAETLFEMMAKQYEVAKIDESNEGAVIQVVDSAQVPEWKSSPKRGLIAVIGTVVGILVSTTFVFLRHNMRRNRNPETASKLKVLLGRRIGSYLR